MKAPSAASLTPSPHSAPESTTPARGVRLARVGLLALSLLELSGCSFHASAKGKTAASSSGGISGESSSSAVFQTKPRTAGIKRAHKDTQFHGTEVVRFGFEGSGSVSTTGSGSSGSGASGSAGAKGSASASTSATASGSASAGGSAAVKGSASGSGSGSGSGGTKSSTGKSNGATADGGGKDSGSANTKPGKPHKDKALAVPAGTRQDKAETQDKTTADAAKPVATEEATKPSKSDKSSKSESGTKKTKEDEAGKSKEKNPPKKSDANATAAKPKEPAAPEPVSTGTPVPEAPAPVAPVPEAPAPVAEVPAPPTPPVEPIEPPAAPPENVFGYEKPIRGCFEGIVFPLRPGTKQLPTSYERLKPISVLYACEWDIPTREWKTGFPGIPDHFEWFAIRYSGSFATEQAGSWTFRISSDDGTRLLIDGKPVIFNDGIHEPRVATAKVDLTAGDHEMVLEYFQGPRFLINLQLFATPPGGEEGIFSVR